MLKKMTIASLLLFITMTGNAQDVKLYKPGETPDPEEVAEILSPAMKMRGIKKSGDADPFRNLTSTDEPRAEEKKQPRALALPVQFAFDSATLLPGALSQIDAVAEGIKLLDESTKIVIEGHTDRFGKEQYNHVLSLRRAESVKAYLVQKHGIEQGKIKTDGKGFNEPYNVQNPFAGENRRVQFKAGA
jgi:OmpA-OmpF porin, OOP family